MILYLADGAILSAGVFMAGDCANPALVLASASPRRRELLSALAVPFLVRPADIDETPPQDATPEQAVRAIAERKALAALKRTADTVLAADTVVILDGRLLGKPQDAATARAMLGALAGRGHDVITAVALVNHTARAVASVRTYVVMRRYTSAEIDTSIDAGTPFDKAGGYAIQDALLHPVARHDGCYCNVMGLPLWTVYGMVRDSDGSLPIAAPEAAFARCAACPLRPLGA